VSAPTTTRPSSAPVPSDGPPAGSAAARQPDGAPPRRKPDDGHVLAAATATIAGGVWLTMLPMHSVFTDWAWFTTSIGCSLPYLAVVIGLRWQRAPRWWHVVLGLAASILALAWVFLPQHLFLGVLPTWASLGDLRALLSQAHETMQSDHAPLHSTPALRLLTAAATVLLVALTDVLGVLLRRPLLAAAPLLEVLAVASATSSSAANPVYFAGAAVGFLLILAAGTRLQDRDWGPSVDGSAGRLGGARRMAITGIVAALVVPVLIPPVSVNLLARATHHNGIGSGSGSGARIELNNTADLSGSLRRGTAVELLKVQVAPSDRPFYIRQSVLDQFTNAGWRQSPQNQDLEYPLYTRNYPVAPASLTGEQLTAPTATIQATFTILSLSGDNLPLLANPADLDPLGGVWDEVTASVHGASLFPNVSYTEQAEQVSPTDEQLRAAPDWKGSGNPAIDQRYVALPPQPPEVRSLADQLTSGLTSAYDKAKAISTYFTDPKNGFVYSLDTAPADGRGALVTFLDKKQGFCQQYAAAAAVLMREAGLPTRVVLGYTHQPPDKNGTFTVTTADAHAWVEVYFSGIGWVPFDPTPLGGADAGRAVALPWATHPSSAPTGSSGAPSTATTRTTRNLPDQPSGAATLATSGRGSSVGSRSETIGIAAVLLLLLALLVTSPQLLRRRQRRRRYRQAVSTGNPEPLWQEVAASAYDQGVLWPETVTVRQVPGWLARRGVDERGAAAIAAVAGNVELARFSSRRPTGLTEDAVSSVDQAIRRWFRKDERRQRVQRWLLPRSVVNRADRSNR
jgi:transglutaminase-like putative cysteine protease